MNNRQPIISFIAGVLLCCLTAAGATAAPTAVVNADSLYPLQGHLDYLPDSAAVTAEQLLSGQFDQQFRRYDDRAVNFQRAPVWLRARITNNTPDNRLIVSVNDVLFAEAALHYAGQELPGRNAGLLHGHVERSWHYHDIAFPVSIESGGSRTLYLYLHTPFFLLLSPYVADEASYAAHQIKQASWGHLMVGVMLGILLYLVMIALYVRGLSEVRHCIAFAAVSLVVLLFGRGYLFNVLPHSPWLNLHIYPLIFSAQAFTYISFSRRHFKTQQDFPLVDRLLRTGEYFVILLFLASVVMPLHWSVLVVIAMTFPLAVMLCICSVYIWANSQRKLTVYIVGTLIFLFACIIAVAENSGFINLDGASRHAYEAGLCLQVVLFALALAEKINLYQREQTKLAIYAAEAQAESRAKSSFLAKMSHELRTPMNGLLGMLQLLEGTPLNEQQHHYTQAMRSSGHTLLGVIDDVLDYSRIVAGKLKLVESDYDLDEVLGDVEAMFASIAGQKQLQLRFSIGDRSALRVHGDAMRLRQILINLVGNAIKFTESGSVAVRLWLEQHSDTQWQLRGEVEDTGIGISAEQLPQLFQEYAQAENTRLYGGSGLGLVICKQLTEMMQGGIHAESAPGYGSLFRFHIEVKPPQNDLVAAQSSSCADRQTQTARILVVEDNDTNREVVVGMLSQLGYSADCVDNGLAAVELFCQTDRQWALVLMDLEMPVMDGLVAARRMRVWEAEQCRDATPIIALTAHVVQGYEEKSLQAGMDDHMHKPIALEQLQAVLAKWLSARAGDMHK